ncbi:unnamed protein product [Clonostachys rhizophaga]|uniref:Uncharacterized protein n=1 Tax=Clonostachys rhizophaga TaxID=160324 RepID=A0A9N9V7C2_9HYPO|nr:unnamed protein product [Clonostachys rhizophaga]
MSTKRLRINDLDSHAKRARPRLNASRISTNSGPAATEDMPPMTMHDDTRSIILADETTPAHQYHDSTDIGGFFAAVNSSNTAEFFDDTIGQFYITESNNVARLIAATDDDDSGMFFASIPTGDFSAPQTPHKPLEQ